MTVLREGNATDPHGEPRTPADELRDVTLLHVWSPSCRTCASEAATLNRLQELDRDGRFTVLAVAVDATPDSVRAFMEENDVRYPVLLADERTAERLREVPQVPWGLVARGFGGWFEVGAPNPSIQAIPWTGLLDRNGLVRRYRGPVKHFEAKLDILAALAEARPSGFRSE